MTLGSRLGNANVSQPWSRQSPEIGNGPVECRAVWIASAEG